MKHLFIIFFTISLILICNIPFINSFFQGISTSIPTPKYWSIGICGTNQTFSSAIGEYKPISQVKEQLIQTDLINSTTEIYDMYPSYRG